MTRCLLRPRAQRDLNEIWDYSAASWSVSQAETYIRQIQDACAMLAEDPRLGRPCDDIRAGYRKFRAGSHFVFYRASRTGSMSYAFYTSGWTSSSISKVLSIIADT
jgi:toxin ParE1/3/4